MQNIGLVLKKIFRIVGGVVLSLCGVVVLMQVFSPVYNLQVGEGFSGQGVWNPYAGVDSVVFADGFRKGNFHAHESRRGMPLESMYSYSPGEFLSLYDSMGYDVVVVSDHQYVNPVSFFWAYEHGINLNNFHVGVWGDSVDVEWFDFPLMFSAGSQMQRMFNILGGDGIVLVLNHPYGLRNGVSAEDLRGVRGYDLIEMGGGERYGGYAPWDVPLSEGYYPRLLNTDDSHYPDSLGHSFQNHYTMVLCDPQGGGEGGEGGEGGAESVKRGLLSGLSYGVDITVGVSPRGRGTEPRFRRVEMLGDTLVVDAVGEVDTIVFIGQGGKVLRGGEGEGGEWRYVLRGEDTYVRAEVYWSNGMRVWLNPVVRYDGSVEELFGHRVPGINWWWTVVMWVVWGVVGVGFMWCGVRIVRGKRGVGRRRLWR